MKEQQLSTAIGSALGTNPENGPSQFIVSANYRDRDSKYRWLVRGIDEEPQQAKAFKHVFATGVIFTDSSAYEEGFGGRLVAKCANVEATGRQPLPGDEPVTNGVRLHFNYSSFSTAKKDPWDDDYVPINYCSALELDSDGHMYADRPSRTIPVRNDTEV